MRKGWDAMRELLRRLVKEEDGQGMAEYGLILALVAIVVIGVLTTMGSNLKAIFERIGGELNPNR
ncbi:Flp family type IVb pilin [Desulfovirgula thermocuniculi]|uniref:Flp family type IVb pilin n=1 Tax=Desulfovirgula thermocuniculi TaxID=348842 RepID=UPI001FDEAD55|nr:Flp family type IVb pilin [Desulfovirgula thermocuniculi]